MKQCEQQRLLGWFHLPEAPDNRVPGILTWEPTDGATLELVGGFSPPPNYELAPDGLSAHTTQTIGNVRPGTIFGETTTGKKLSIWDAQRGNYSANAITHQMHQEFWSSSWVCIGAHVSDPEEERFTKVTIVLDELYYLIGDPRFCPPQWAKIEGVDNPGEPLDNGTLLKPYVLPVVGGIRSECDVTDTESASYSINTRATAPWVSEATEAMPSFKLDMMTNNLRRGPVIELAVGANASVKLPGGAAGGATDFVDRISPITDLVRLATFDSCGIETIALSTLDDEHTSLLSRIGEPAVPNGKHEPMSVVFDFADVPLTTYLAVRESLTGSRQADYAWSVIIGHCGYSPRFTEQYVSQVLAAAEGFHTWCLKNTGDPTLKARLTALHDSLAPELKSQLKLDVDNWAEWAVWARHHVAHGGTKNRKFISDGMQTLAVAKTVHLVTYLAVLHELDVPVKKLTNAVINHPRLRAFVPHCEIVNRIQPPSTSGAH
jgi:hypothetical protein